MSAEIDSKRSKYIFDIISIILIKNNCVIKDINFQTGVFKIGGKNKKQINKCQSDIDRIFSIIYERAINDNASFLWW